MLRMLRAMYRSTTAAVRGNGRYTTDFEVGIGVRQGDVLSPVLFDVFINDLVDALKRDGIGVYIPGLEGDSPFSAMPPKLAGLLWADDVVITADSLDQLRRALRVVDEWCSTWSMKTNANKCGVMVVSSEAEAEPELAEAAVRDPFTVSGAAVAPVDVYKYLGVHLRCDLTWETEIEARLDAIRRATFKHANVLQNRDLSAEVRRHYYEAVVVPVALWGCEMWAENKVVCSRVEKALATALRLVAGANKKVSRVALGREPGV